MVVLQAYQANLLKDLGGREEEESNIVAELRCATDLSLQATKETTRAIGCSMSALVVESVHITRQGQILPAECLPFPGF